jgi:hypothetical protein
METEMDNILIGMTNDKILRSLQLWENPAPIELREQQSLPEFFWTKRGTSAGHAGLCFRNPKSPINGTLLLEVESNSDTGDVVKISDWMHDFYDRYPEKVEKLVGKFGVFLKRQEDAYSKFLDEFEV